MPGRVIITFDDGETFEAPMSTIWQIKAERKHGSVWLNEHRTEGTLWVVWEQWKQSTGKAEPFDTFLMRVEEVREISGTPTQAPPSEPSPE